MQSSRRRFLNLGAATAAYATLRPAQLFAAGAATDLKPLTGNVKPIARGEYLARIANAQRLMAQHGIGALLIEP
jgi:Xaa-Pro dipeptidase